jgi:2-aminomuconate deaminase
MEHKMKLQTHLCPAAPKPLGNYCHAASVGDLIFVAGIASRDFVTDQVPGLKLDAQGNVLSYDIRQETCATLENIRKILESVNSDLEHIVEVNTYLLNMKDFGAYNEVYAEFFPKHHPARTTVAVAGLPGKIAIEMKVTAVKRS